ncbi:MAG: hypothetical protein P0Y55_11680 [Candidatus Cohnella colombiensis]|uniref:Sporulation membrane protein YtrI C-terminal domain-containing protein n=1 Tax=Candidatus Cohnella colombiensis TaxID=3121368 RepID=A0AA95EU34_9BACL|nr:MAG: hypothetical protein P0Y55_11680 [Cohnella sp.]
MRIPNFARFQRFMQLTAFFVCGMIVGSAIYSALLNDQYNLAIISNRELIDQLDSIKKELKQKEEIHKSNVIKRIVAHIEEQQGKSPIDKITEGELKKRLRADMEIFLGRSIYSIDSDAQLARILLESKVYEDIGDKDYEVNIMTILVVDNVLQIWVEVKLHLPK